MITFKNKYDGSLVMSQQTHAQEVTSHFPVARLVTIGHFQSEQSLVVVAQWEEHTLSVSPTSEKVLGFQLHSETVFNARQTEVSSSAITANQNSSCFLYMEWYLKCVFFTKLCH